MLLKLSSSTSGRAMGKCSQRCNFHFGHLLARKSNLLFILKIASATILTESSREKRDWLQAYCLFLRRFMLIEIVERRATMSASERDEMNLICKLNHKWFHCFMNNYTHVREMNFEVALDSVMFASWMAYGIRYFNEVSECIDQIWFMGRSVIETSPKNLLFNPN